MDLLSEPPAGQVIPYSTSKPPHHAFGLKDNQIHSEEEAGEPPDPPSLLHSAQSRASIQPTGVQEPRASNLNPVLAEGHGRLWPAPATWPHLKLMHYSKPIICPAMLWGH